MKNNLRSIRTFSAYRAEALSMMTAAILGLSLFCGLAISEEPHELSSPREGRARQEKSSGTKQDLERLLTAFQESRASEKRQHQINTELASLDWSNVDVGKVALNFVQQAPQDGSLKFPRLLATKDLNYWVKFLEEQIPQVCTNQPHCNNHQRLLGSMLNDLLNMPQARLTHRNAVRDALLKSYGNIAFSMQWWGQDSDKRLPAWYWAAKYGALPAYNNATEIVEGYLNKKHSSKVYYRQALLTLARFATSEVGDWDPDGTIRQEAKTLIRRVDLLDPRGLSKAIYDNQPDYAFGDL